MTNNVIGRRRLIDVGAKQQNSIGKIVPFLLHRFLDWILLLLLRQSPPYRSICVAHVFSKTTFSSGLMITKLKSNTKTTGWNKRPGASPYADDPAKLTGNVKGIYSKSERLLKLMLFVDLFDAGVEGGRVVAVEAGKAEVGAVTGLEKTILGKERQRIGLDGLTGLLKVS